MAKRIITETDVLEAAQANKGLSAPLGECIITDQARDRARDLGVELLEVCQLGGNAQQVDASVAASASAPLEQGLEQLVRQVCGAVREQMPPGADPVQVERLVREAIKSRMSASPRPPSTPATPDGVVFIESRNVLKKAAGAVPAQDKALLAEVLGPSGKSQLAAGYLAWEGASFSRVVEVSEVGIVIEGELHLTVGGQTIIGRPGDMIYLPQGVKAVYSAPAKVTMACVNGVS